MSEIKKKVPPELRRVLLDFTVSYLLEQPDDIIEHAYNYFAKLRENRPSYVTKPSPSSPDDSIPEDEEPPRPMKFGNRRKSVFAEAYNPEEDDDNDQPKVYPKSDEQRKALADSVKNILLFRSLDPAEVSQVLDAMFEKIVKEGDVIIKQGDDGDNFYVIENGLYEASINLPSGESKVIFTYQGKGSFGELALLYNMPRAATIKATSQGALWAMDRATFRRIVLKSAFKKRKMYESLIDRVPMLKALESYERMNLADALIPKTYEEGQRIIKQGDAADGMYFIESGTISITIMDDAQGEVKIKEIQEGDYFGELALLTHKPRAASAYAVTNVKVAFLDVEAFERLLGPCLDILKRNIHNYESQLKNIFGSKHNLSDIR